MYIPYDIYILVICSLFYYYLFYFFFLQILIKLLTADFLKNYFDMKNTSLQRNEKNGWLVGLYIVFEVI